MLKQVFFLMVVFIFVCVTPFQAQVLEEYDVSWNSPSENASESMPCGGGDIGMNVWVEDGDLLFYFSRSGTFDEHNTLLKLGRIRLRLHPNPFEGERFEQRLRLGSGSVEIVGGKGELETRLSVYADVFRPVIHLEVQNKKALRVEAFYENWRYRDRELRKGECNQNSYKWAPPKGLATRKDEVSFQGKSILFYHRNSEETVFDATVRGQGLDSLASRLFNPLKYLTFGGTIWASDLLPAGSSSGVYADTDYRAWKLESLKPLRSTHLCIALHTEQTESYEAWEQALGKVKADAELSMKKGRNKKENLAWWRAFWERSFVRITPGATEGQAFRVGRNYHLFRYMLACNAYGQSPTKFNGGLFTYDPCYVDSTRHFTPDFRNWGGGTHTAQNQRLVYFPMLKSGDFDFMNAQFDFYLKALPAAEWRSRAYWGHEGACFTEQLENFGLPNLTEYSVKRPAGFDPGVEYNAWLEYQWDTVLEFCLMILEQKRYAGADIQRYMPLVESCLRFFDEHYRYRAKFRGRKELDGDGKLILYPGTACETYKMAYNATSTIAALTTMVRRVCDLPEELLPEEKRNYFKDYLQRIPAIRTREIEGQETLSPAWVWERVNNVESPQLYPVFPWGMYGLGRPELEVALNTWRYDPDVKKFRSHVGWKQDAIWAARLGLTEEASALTFKKLDNARERRFPTFWGPGYDWTPDHNWGGSGMIALQEMLMQVVDNRILLLPAWPADLDVHFKLHAPDKTTVECQLKDGKIVLLNVNPESRRKDVESHFQTYP